MLSDAWRFTQQISCRSSVRLSVRDSSGVIQHRYPIQHRLDAEAPVLPWAINLTDVSGNWHFLVFDLDTTHATAEAVQADCDQLADWLDKIGIPTVVCASGPTHGRHVWVALAEPMRSPTVALLARSLARRLPTLDIGPLMNAATGIVRPPGAPHRHGGRSEILSGHRRTLTHPIALAEPLERWIARMAADDLVADMAAVGETPEQASTRATVRDASGILSLAGEPRPLPPASQQALDSPVTQACDASAVLMRVLVGAVAASWRYGQVRDLVATAPGLEYARTVRDGAKRVPRPPKGKSATDNVLRQQWDKAVAFVTSTPRQRTEDAEFTARASAIAALVERVQTRADAAPGYWGTGAGPTMRRVLDALCLLALRGVVATVEADQRRLAVLCGIGAQTARRGLARLAEDGWIVLAEEAEGVRGRRWKIAPQDVFHSIPSRGGPQGTPPPSLGASRHSLLGTLTNRLTLAAHDIFTPHGLGHHAGNVYARAEFNEHPGPDHAELLQLARAGLITPSGPAWIRTHPDTRDLEAMWHGADGTLATRAARIADERELWAWWQAELSWITAPRPKKKRPKPYTSLFVLDPVTQSIHGRYPRTGPTRHGRADFGAARRFLRKPSLADSLIDIYHEYFNQTVQLDTYRE